MNRTATTRELPVLVIVGPTASGKTSLSLQIAAACDAEIVNADSVLLYRGMDIGSAKPTVAERAQIPHHVIDVWDIDHEATVAEFQQLARDAIAQVHRRDKVPIVVGGSSLYIRAVLDDLEFPGTDPQVRARWYEELELRGAERLHEVLAERDPEAAAVILSSNGRRIVRALEVIEITGRPFRATLPAFDSIYPRVLMLGLAIDRDTLDARIAERVDAMWHDGLVEEVRSLPGLATTPTASRAIGYQQVLAHLAGDLTEAEARSETINGTRRLARSQQRMLRKDPRIIWLSHDDPELVSRALDLVAQSSAP